MAVAALVAEAGCLILGSVNHRPSLRLEVPKGELHRGQSVTITAVGTDEDEGETSSLTFEWVVQFRGQTTKWLSPDGSLLSQVPERSAEGRSLTLSLPDHDELGGSYSVSVVATARDAQRATDRASAELTVENRPPLPRIVLSNYSGEPTPAKLPRHVVHIASAAMSSDADDTADRPSTELGCGVGKVETRWEAVDPPQSAFTLWQVQACKGSEVLDKLVWKLPPSSETTQVTLRLTVVDRWGGEASVERRYDVAPDGTACIESAEPDFASMVSAGSPPTKVAVVIDDIDDTLGVGSALIISAGGVATSAALSTLRYRWQSAESAVGPWTTIAGQGASTLTLSDLLPGQRRFYRAIVAIDDAGLEAIGCAADVAFCEHASGLPAGCHQWISWEVEAK
ncbi:MAG: hypothetical protein CSA65_08820 [Proteobacteria bacterium]|nr:MAG: hypothetical protein CSB49_07365 [Pseudomonadota bacterium]PIE17473.1 MAG: hypothetical protein CSA65_08820 [Pseudomonadota bacterium]